MRVGGAPSRGSSRAVPAALVMLIAAVAAVSGSGCSATRGAAGAETVYQRGAVAADHPVASLAGLEMLRLGGNAVDAAVAASFTLSVVRPYSCGIGGGGFMLIHDPGGGGGDGLQLAIDYREWAAAAVGPEYYVDLQERTGRDELSRFGPHAAGVPGTVAGLLWALEHHGTLDRATVLAPAIRAAEEGFAADESFVEAARELKERLDERPWARPAAAFLLEELCAGGDLAVGDPIRNLPQARALRLIAEHGRRGFYEGPVARAVVEAMRLAPHELGEGPITAADLREYQPRILAPLRGSFRGRTVLSMPPPSSGGIAMQQTLGIIERRSDVLDVAPHLGPDYVHLVTEAMKHAFADRSRWLADPDFASVPVNDLLASAYLDRMAASVDMKRTRDLLAYGSVQPAPQDRGTSHLSVIDGNGMAVACTETINLSFGSLVCVPGFGFALNDEMDDFTTIPGEPNAFGLRQSDLNLPEPGKRPLSSMSPTIVLDGEHAVIVAGASGGPRIITGTLQCMLNCLLADMTPSAAVGAPRFHHQWLPETLRFEERWTDEATITEMERRGHGTERTSAVGVVQLIRVDEEGIRAASDPRKGGRPAGY